MTLSRAALVPLPLLFVVACQSSDRVTGPAPRAAAIAHGGVGSPANRSDGPRAAVDAALAALRSGASPVDAAVAGIIVLENDARFNAGTGSMVRLDGTTVQMDASVMTSDGRYGAVAVIEQVKNPIIVARAVMDSPHNVIAGDGATRFARTLGLPVYDPATEHRREQTRDIVRRLQSGDPELEESWLGFDWRAHWNFEASIDELGLGAGGPIVAPPDTADAGADTVGVAVRSADGSFAVALSTGGTSTTLRGRVGDVPILGAGLYAGPHGAVAATGKGERITEASSSRRAHERIAAGDIALWSLERGVVEIRGRGSIGLIVVTADELTAAADRSMAWAARVEGSAEYLGPEPGPDRK